MALALPAKAANLVIVAASTRVCVVAYETQTPSNMFLQIVAQQMHIVELVVNRAMELVQV